MITLTVFENQGERFGETLTRMLRGVDVRVTRARAKADVAVVSPGYTGTQSAECSVLLAPDGAGARPIAARSVITYGMSPRATLTLSSIGERSCVLAVQREIVTARGDVVEEQELEVPALGGTYTTLAVAGGRILLGLLPRSVTYISSNTRL
ncbi:MAG: hypothetical protein LBN99_07650 [Oscillospiraceae bacterium]|nr:hypothetical protein [Oscillospiraceae bacterium]